MLRAIKIRLYPNKEQATMFNKLLGYMYGGLERERNGEES